MYLRLQPGPGDGGEHPVAAVRPLRRRPERQGDPRPADQQVQGLRLRHHDQLRREPGGHPVAQRVHPRQQGAPGQLQDQQQEELNRKKKRGKKKGGRKEREKNERKNVKEKKVCVFSADDRGFTKSSFVIICHYYVIVVY